jgi:WD40 repeat protein
MGDYPKPQSFAQAAAEAVDLLGGRAVDMRKFPASGDPPVEEVRERVQNADVYIGLIGLRYGSTVDGGEGPTSYTRFEFLTAGAAGKKQLVFMLDENAPMPRCHIDSDPTDIDEFRRYLRDDAGVVVATFTTVDELKLRVMHALYDLAEKRRRCRRPQMVSPFAPGEWVDRGEKGKELRNAVLAPGGGEVWVTTDLREAGGFGKSHLARWVCLTREVRKHFPGGVLWAAVGAGLRGAGLAECVNELSVQLLDDPPPLGDPDAAGRELGRRLDRQERDCGRVLLVVDDVWEEEVLRPFRYGGRNCTRLVTTRMPSVVPPAGDTGIRVVKVNEMNPEQAARLAGRGIRRLPEAVRRELVLRTGGWPLLLKLVNGLLTEWENSGTLPPTDKEIVRRLEKIGLNEFDHADSEARAKMVAAVVEEIRRLLGADDEKFLDLAIFPVDVEVPVDILAFLWSARAQKAHRVDVLCKRLHRLGLVAEYRKDGRRPRLRLHDVIYDYLSAQHDVDHVKAHVALVEAAADVLEQQGPPSGSAAESAAWWTLPEEASYDYLWHHLVFHLVKAGMRGEAEKLLKDLRWAAAKTRVLRSPVPVEVDCALLTQGSKNEYASELGDALGRAAHLLTPIEPPAALGATLASRLGRSPGLEHAVASYRENHLPRPRLGHDDEKWELPDLPHPALIRVFHDRHGPTYGARCSPAGDRVASAGTDGTVRVWDLTSYTKDRKEGRKRGPTLLTGYSGRVYDFAFAVNSSGRELIATTGDDGMVRVWDLAAPATPVAVLKSYDDDAVRGRGSSPGRAVRGCGFSSDGARVVSASTDGMVRVWDLAAPEEPVAVLKGHDGAVLSCGFPPDPGDNRVVSAGKDGTVRIWDVAGGREVVDRLHHKDPMYSCAFSPVVGDDRVVHAGLDGIVRIWEMGTGTVSRLEPSHNGAVYICTFSGDGSRIVSAGEDGTVRTWEAASRRAQDVLTGHGDRVNGSAFSVLFDSPAGVFGCTFSEKDTRIVSAGGNQEIRIWRAETEPARQPVHPDRTRRTWSCAFSPDGRRIVFAGADGTLQIWDESRGTVLSTLTDHKTAALADHKMAVYSCAFSRDGELVVSGGVDGKLRVWDANAGEKLAEFTGHRGSVHGCGFSPDGRRLVSAGDDGTVRIWDPAVRNEDERELAVLTGHDGPVRCCAFSPADVRAAVGKGETVQNYNAETGLLGGSRVASGGQDGTVRIWDAETGGRQNTLTGHHGPVYGCTFSPDGKLLVSVGEDGTVRIWDTVSGRELDEFAGHAAWVRGCAFSPDGTLIVTVGGDGEVRVWDTTAATCTAALRVAEPLLGCAWHPSENVIAAAGSGGAYLFKYIL